MHKSCSSCELVNWPDAVNCRRCGHPLGASQNTAIPRLRGKEIVREIKLTEDDDLQFEQPLKLIRSGVVAGALGSLFSFLAFTLLNILIATPNNFLRQALIELGITLALTIGVHCKSRVCAALLLGCFTIGKLILLVQGQIAFVGLFIGLLFAKALYQGWQGTLQYQKIKARKTRQAHA